jgi:hypothetical protein
MPGRRFDFRDAGIPTGQLIVSHKTLQSVYSYRLIYYISAAFLFAKSRANPPTNER